MIPARLFYFVRHGQTDANTQGLMCGGDWDIPLNVQGRIQAEGLAPSLIELTPKIQKIFVSPMQRALETAKLLNNAANLELEVVEGLREWRVGQWERKPWGEVPNPFNTTEEPAEGELRADFETRIETAVANILNGYRGTPLIVSHGAAAHALFTVMGTDLNLIDNCVIYQIQPVNKRWIISPAT
jgi:2,3-bisphosphoglycerate-dependent phosphoglycerate mutase